MAFTCSGGLVDAGDKMTKGEGRVGRVTFEDVAVDISWEEWKVLEEKRDSCTSVMLENGVLAASLAQFHDVPASRAALSLSQELVCFSSSSEHPTSFLVVLHRGCGCQVG